MGKAGIAAVRIGAFINPSSRIGREQTVAIQIAIQDFSSFTSNIELTISNSSDEVENLVNKWGANAIVSTGPWLEEVRITKIADKARLPVVSLATSQPLAIFHKPYLFRLSYSTSGYIQCLADLVKLYKWRQLVVLYEDDDYGSTSASGIPLLNDALRAVGSEICKHVAFPPLDSLADPEALVHQELKALSKQLCTVYIVLGWSSPSMAMELFKEAKALGMMDNGHVWIAGDDITSLLDSNFNPSFISSYMQGMLGIKTNVNESAKSYYEFSTKFRQRFQEEYNVTGEVNYDPGLYALQAYDAVHVIVQAQTKHTLLEGMRSTNLDGLSGRVMFNADGNLVEGKGSLVFRVINVVGRSYKDLGFWSKGMAFYRDEQEMVSGGMMVDPLGPVNWPGGPDKVPGGWNKLKIGVPSLSHLLVKVEFGENGKADNFSGFCIDIFQKARKRLNYELPYEFIAFNGTYPELVASVPEVFDAVVGDITILAERLENATFTMPFLPSALSRVVRLKPERTPWMLTKPFTNAVWLLIVAALVYNCFCIWYLEHRRNPDFDGPWWNQVGAALWLIFSSIFFANGSLHSYYTKSVIVVWFFVVLILTSSFTANLSSILNSKKFEPNVSDGKVGCDNNSFAVKYLQDVLGYKPEQIVLTRHVDEYADNFERGIIESAYLETESLRVFLADHDGYTVYGDSYNFGGLGFVFPKGSPLADDFSHAILELLENGAIKELENKWFSLSFTSCPRADTNRDSYRLGLESFWALFLITGAVSTIVVFVFKARLLPRYGHKTRVYIKSWRSRQLKSFKVRHLCRKHSTSSKQISPEPADDLSSEV